jgi:hypothetical protein
MDYTYRLVWAAYERDNALANVEYDRSRELADRPVLCGKRLHEMKPGNIRIDPYGKRHCVTCERAGDARRRREQRAHRRNRVA